MRPVVTALAGRLAAGAAAVLAGGLLATSVAPAHAAIEPDPRAPWFGPDLDWRTDTAEAYVDRLGTDVSLFGRSFVYPLNDSTDEAISDLSDQAADEGAVAVVTLQPTSLTEPDAQDAERLGGLLADLAEADGSTFLVRFAPEMNGSWTAWGQQPRDYVRAFTTVADGVHAATDEAAMVWAPAYGAGYPFDRAVNSTTTSADAPAISPAARRVLDTDGDGRVTEADDPYGPYYPGDDVVDWVGLTMLRYGVTQQFGANTVPAPDELDERFKERFGYGDDLGRKTFYVRFAGTPNQPFLLTTSALWNPRADGPDALAIQRPWWRQVLAATEERPRLGGVLWLEQERDEPEIGNLVEWGLTANPAIARAFRTDLLDSGYDLGPVAGTTGGTDPDRADGGDSDGDDRSPAASPTSETDDEAAGPQDGGVPPFALGAISAVVVLLAAAMVALSIRRRRMRPPWLR